MYRLTIWGVVLSLCFITTAMAQLTGIKPGTLLRVTLQKELPNTVMGKLVLVNEDSLKIQVGHRYRQFSWKKIQTVKAAIKTRHYMPQGIMMGSVLGAAILGAYFYQEEQKAQGFAKVGQPGLVGGMLMGVAVGSMAGAYIGLHITSPVWVTVYPEN